MGQVKFKLNHAGVRELLRSEEVKKMTEEYSQNYEGKKKTFVGSLRAKTFVFPDDKHHQND